jgi:hypothetical protein
MRVVLGAGLLAVVAPAGGVRSCAGPAAPEPLQVQVSQPLPDGSALGPVAPGAEVRIGCWDGTRGDFADPVSDTVPLAEGLVVTEPCELYAFRRTGGLWSRSEGARVHPGDRDTLVSFALPEVGGVGIGFARDPWREGMAVTAVYPGTPADGALSRGDVIVAVDGVAAGRTRWGFAEQVTGEPGTEVTLTVRSVDGPRREVTLDRAVLRGE